MARTLLESTIKTILDDRGVAYHRKDDLPALYRTVSRELGLAPDGYSDEAFGQILGGCSSVVTGLGALRNQVGDAHGAGRTRYRAAARHATLAVNLAGSMALFLIETHEATSARHNP
jgi:abortive infection Abi-like protein